MKPSKFKGTLEKRQSSLSLETDYSLDYQAPEAFFCKVENAIHEKSKWLCKFRLGDVDYVDRLEGKYIPTVLPSNNPFLYAHSTKQYKQGKKKKPKS